MATNTPAAATANPVVVARFRRAYERAIHAEENASTLADAWSLAKASARCLRDLRIAMVGGVVPTRRRRPRASTIARRAGLAGLAVLGAIGRAVKGAVTRLASLAKARAVRAARRAVAVAVTPANATSTTPTTPAAPRFASVRSYIRNWFAHAVTATRVFVNGNNKENVMATKYSVRTPEGRWVGSPTSTTTDRPQFRAVFDDIADARSVASHFGGDVMVSPPCVGWSSVTPTVVVESKRDVATAKVLQWIPTVTEEA